MSYFIEIPKKRYGVIFKRIQKYFNSKGVVHGNEKRNENNGW